jgi:uncharacterized protein with von Willebrand factor type A (vWA) domain
MSPPISHGRPGEFQSSHRVASDELELGYAALDRLPDALFERIVTHPLGTLEARARGLVQWREALLEGRLPGPDILAWPDPPLRGALLSRLHALDVAPLCRLEPALADALLEAGLRVASAAEAGPEAGLENGLENGLETEFAALRELERLDRVRAARDAGEPAAEPADHAAAEPADHAAAEPAAEPADHAAAEPAAEPADHAAAEPADHAAQTAAEAMCQDWRERIRLWIDARSALEEARGHFGRGWDLSRGLGSSADCLEILRLRDLVARLPRLRALLRMLGRLEAGGPERGGEPSLSRILEPMRADARPRPVSSLLAREELRDLTRSDDLARMVPAEAALLRTPRLRTLWHARRAEHALASHRLGGMSREEPAHAPASVGHRSRETPRLERGPLLLCLDGSASTEGAPAVISGALALAALRMAAAEGRRCHLTLFGGPDQQLELELSASEQGLAALLAVLSQAFGGGTDVERPLLSAVTRLEDARWARADLLLVSDGGFEAPAAAVEALNRARESRGLRVHGVLLGSGSSEAMDALCDHVHRFTDWEEDVE